MIATANGAPDRLRRLTPERESIEAEVAFAVEEEMGGTLPDVVFRRTGLGDVGKSRRILPAALRGDHARASGGWSDTRMTEEMQRDPGAVFGVTEAVASRTEAGGRGLTTRPLQVSGDCTDAFLW